MPVFKLLLVLLTLVAHGQASETGARDVIDNFYRAYLGSREAQGDSRRELNYSASLKALIEENYRLCRWHADGICGWGANEDVYLNTQEVDPDLHYESSAFQAVEVEPGQVTVTFNVYPSMTEAGDYYLKQFTYHLVQEHGIWVVDDIDYPRGTSAREMINEENRWLVSQPCRLLNHQAQ